MSLVQTPFNENRSLVSLKIFCFIFITFTLLACEKDKVIQNRFVPERPYPEDGSSLEKSCKYADVLREKDKDFMDSINDPSLTAVTREFGFTKITAKEFPFHSGMAHADIKPWSSWWFPKIDPTLFDDSRASDSKDYDQLSTLTKFDLVKKSYHPNASSASRYERRAYNPNALAWEGLCDAWAIASISFPEPKKPVSINLKDSDRKITFEVGDLKGLLLKTLEAVDDQPFKYYGQRFTGQESGWIYPDIFPEQFHRFLEIQLFEKHKAFIIDTDQGVEMWSAPVFKANYTMTEIPNEPNSIFVRTWLYLADSIKTKDLNFIGTKEVVREYNYVLKGERDANGDLIVNLGYWVKGPQGHNSRHDHPDFIIVPPEPEHLKRQSWNPEIDTETVDAILSDSY